MEDNSPLLSIGLSARFIRAFPNHWSPYIHANRQVLLSILDMAGPRSSRQPLLSLLTLPLSPSPYLPQSNKPAPFGTCVNGASRGALVVNPMSARQRRCDTRVLTRTNRMSAIAQQTATIRKQSNCNDSQRTFPFLVHDFHDLRSMSPVALSDVSTSLSVGRRGLVWRASLVAF